MTNSLQAKLATLPDNLTLVAIGNNKAPYLPRWQTNPMGKADIRQELQGERCKAVGVLCGVPSGGLLFLDHDGESCDRLIESLSSQPLAGALPKTVGITSGRPGRYQLIYRVPEQYWEAIATKRLNTGTTDDDGKAEQLEFRWNGCQSVVIGHHPMTAGYRYLPGQSFAECGIAEAPLWMVEQMLVEKVQRAPGWNQFCQEFVLPINEVVPLYICLSRKSREAIDSGVPEGNRDNAGAALARDLIGTASYLASVGQLFEGNPLQMLATYCDRCSPPLTPKDSDRLWRSAEKSNPTPSLSQEQIANCIKGWLWREQQHLQPSQPVKVARARKPNSSPKASETLTLEELQERIRHTIALSPTETELTAQVLVWASLAKKTEVSIWQLVRAIQREWERQESRADVRNEIDYLSRLSNYQPQLSAYLDPKLSEPLDRMAEVMGTTGMAMLTTLLPTAGSLLPLGTELEVNPTSDYKVYPIIYTGIVAESGSGKSPAQKTILKPLFRLQTEAEEDYQQAIADWEVDFKAAKQADEPTPPKPKPREYFTTDATREAVVQIQANQPNRGFLGWFDELSGLINSQNQYRGGRGSDKEALLSGRDGSAQKIDRAGGKRLFISRSGYSITGSTQPDTLRGMMGNFKDSSGQWARFLWCFLPIQEAPYQSKSIPNKLSDLLYGTYKHLAAMPVTTYRWSPEAKALYTNWYDELDRLRMTEVKQSMRAVYAKFKGDTAVLALLLHCLDAAVGDGPPAPGKADRTPEEEISPKTLQAAIKLAKFYLGQVKLVHSEGETLNGELAPSFCKILALSKRKGWITARDISRAHVLPQRRLPTQKIRELMQELATMGLAQTQGTGNRLAIRSIQPSENPKTYGDNGGDSLATLSDSGDTSSESVALSPTEPPPSNPECVGDTVAKNPPTVAKLSPAPERLQASRGQGFSAPKNKTVATVATNSKSRNGRRSRELVFRVGDICRYSGPQGAMNVTCWGRDLEVVAIANGKATVKAESWATPHEIPLRHLRKVL